jgi:plasmid replication initiation protein
MEQLTLFKIDSDQVKPKEYSVTKANTLIEANYKLTLTQQRIVLLMASMVQPGDEDFKTYRIYVRDLLDILDINRSHLYEQMIVMIRNLMKVVVTINLPDEKYLDTHWIDSQKYEVGGGYSDVTFHPELKPFFLRLKEKFTTYKLENVMRLKSIYSIRIYELLKQYQGIGKRSITIEKLRKMLGIEPKEYQHYGHFKSKVIEVAYREINEKTDILFDYRETKLGRKVNELEFIITKKAAPEKPREASAPAFVEDKAAARLKKKIDAYIEKLSPEELERLTICHRKPYLSLSCKD